MTLMTLGETIEYLEKMVETDEIYDIGELIEKDRQLLELLTELKQLREQTRWIPVSERLPNHDEYIKNNGLFNVSDGNRSYSEWFDICDKQRFGEPTMNGFRVDYAVTHWMPLPLTYKAESEEV